MVQPCSLLLLAGAAPGAAAGAWPEGGRDSAAPLNVPGLSLLFGHVLN